MFKKSTLKLHIFVTKMCNFNVDFLNISSGVIADRPQTLYRGEVTPLPRPHHYNLPRRCPAGKILFKMSWSVGTGTSVRQITVSRPHSFNDKSLAAGGVRLPQLAECLLLSAPRSASRTNASVSASSVTIAQTSSATLRPYPHRVNLPRRITSQGIWRWRFIVSTDAPYQHSITRIWRPVRPYGSLIWRMLWYATVSHKGKEKAIWEYPMSLT